MARKLNRPAAPFLQIAEELRRQIRDGELQPGEIVPSVRALSREYSVAMATAHRALSTLQAEGYVRPERGVGSVVTTDEERGSSASEWVRRSRRTGRIYPEGQHARIIDAGLEQASEQVAGALGIEPGAEVIRRRRITYRSNHPVSQSSSWLRGKLADIAPRLLAADRIVEGTFAYAAKALGRQLGSWQDQYEPAVASADEADSLGIPAGTPVFRGRNWIYDDQGDVLEYGESVSTGRVIYRGEMTD